MEKFLKWTVLFIVLIILASGGVAFYSVFVVTDNDKTVMPPFRDMSLIDAITHAEQMELKIRVVQMESKLPTGRVLAQSPEPGTKLRGIDKNIILYVSKSGERRPIPDIRGIELTRATGMLEEQGFVRGDVIYVKDSSSNKIPTGQVIAQSPAAPGNIPAGYKVDLLVSEGTDDGRIAVPDVSQMAEQAARRTLESAGLKVASVEKAFNKDTPEGAVVSTRPNIGSLVKAGEGIKIIIAMKEEPKPKSVDEPTSIPGRPVAEPKLVDDSINMLDQPRWPRDPNVLPERPESSRIQNDPHSPEFNIPSPTGSATTPPGVPAAKPTPEVAANTGSKNAKIRYQAPPLLRPMPLRIEIEDVRGKRVLLERNVRSTETVQIDGSYTQEAKVTIWLGGESVWEEEFK